MPHAPVTYCPQHTQSRWEAPGGPKVAGLPEEADFGLWSPPKRTLRLQVDLWTLQCRKPRLYVEEGAGLARMYDWVAEDTRTLAWCPGGLDGPFSKRDARSLRLRATGKGVKVQGVRVLATRNPTWRRRRAEKSLERHAHRRLSGR